MTACSAVLGRGHNWNSPAGEAQAALLFADIGLPEVSLRESCRRPPQPQTFRFQVSAELESVIVQRPVSVVAAAVPRSALLSHVCAEPRTLFSHALC